MIVYHQLSELFLDLEDLFDDFFEDFDDFDDFESLEEDLELFLLFLQLFFEILSLLWAGIIYYSKFYSV